MAVTYLPIGWPHDHGRTNVGAMVKITLSGNLKKKTSTATLLINVANDRKSHRYIFQERHFWTLGLVVAKTKGHNKYLLYQILIYLLKLDKMEK